MIKFFVYMILRFKDMIFFVNLFLFLNKLGVKILDERVMYLLILFFVFFLLLYFEFEFYF